MVQTFVVCGKCGKKEELHTAKGNGWLIATRKGKPWMLIIRCPSHVTAYALRIAGERR